MKLKPTWVELRGTLLVLLAIAITILFVGGAGALWKREYALGTLLLAVGSSMAFAFFRRWKLDLVMVGLVWIMVNAGLTAMVRPSTAGMFLTVGAALGIVLLGRWKASRDRTSQG